MPLREAHAANAAVTFIAFVVATFFATIDPIAAGTAPGTGLSMGGRYEFSFYGLIEFGRKE